MKTLNSVIAMFGCLVASAALAHSPPQSEAMDDAAEGGQASSPLTTGDSLIRAVATNSDHAALEAPSLIPGADIPSSDTADLLVVHRSPASRGSPFGYIGLQANPPLGLSAAFVRQLAADDMTALLRSERWLGTAPVSSSMLVIGHTWRDVAVEGAAFSTREERRAPERGEALKFDSRTARLSFSPSEGWVVRLSRGTASGLDHLVAGGEVRRTALSATYRQTFADGDWQTTVAWGRNSRKSRESTKGYLFESTVRFNAVHMLFGRVEQAGSDELARENESVRRQLFKMNKLTIGYAQDMQITNALKLDIGAYMSRYFVPSGMTPSYGSAPTAYMMFVRVKLQ